MALSKDERDGMLQLMSDLSKDALGFRLRLDFASMTDDELQDHWDYLNRELESSMAREEQQEAQAWADFESYLDRMEAAAMPSYLSGLVIGEELRSQALVPGGEVVAMGSGALTQRYARALSLQGVQARAVGAEATWQGLWALSQTLETWA